MNTSIIDENKLKKNLKEFDKEGLAKFENVIDQEIINTCQETTLTLFKRFSKSEFSKFINISFDNEDFNKEIINFKKIDKVSFGKVYDTLQSSLCLKAIATSPLLVDLASKFLKIKSSSLMVRSTNLRIDVPEDKRNIVNWHFDAFSPNDSNHIPLGGLTMVIPFTKFSLENGCPEFCLGSHKKHPKQNIKKTKDNNSEVYSIDYSYLKNYKKIRLTANPRDLIIFPMTAVHRSGFNISKEVRVCALIRYYSYEHESFHPLRESYLPIV